MILFYTRTPLPAVVAVPTLTRRIEDFWRTPRNFVRMIANASTFGGSFVGMPSIEAPIHFDDHGTAPVPAGCEAIVIADFDKYETRPARLGRVSNTILGYSVMSDMGRDQALDDGISSLDSLQYERAVAGDYN